jgi:asparagine synthase (glutamine-hydrolysing)
MLTNGFGLFKGEAAPLLARGAAKRVARYAREVLVSTGGEFEPLDSARLSGKREVALAYSLGKGTFPLVHGYLEEGMGRGETAVPEGEFSLLGDGAAGFYGARDALGTRGLWGLRGGTGAGSLASDYRLLGGRARLLPRGTVYPRRRARKTTRRQKEAQVVLAFEDAARKLASLLEDSVKRCVLGQSRVAVSFSGGLDSSLLALLASRQTDVVLCSAFAPGSRDEVQTDKAAALLGLKLETALLDEEAVMKRSGEAELPPGDATVMDKALWCIYSATSELAMGEKAQMILLGQLADELFGGYRKYAIEVQEGGTAAAERMMRADVRACADRGFLRDEAACSAFAEVRFPFADARVASFADGLPLDYKIRGGERKAVLRAAAMELGLPEELASAPKKAAQFSSGAAKLLKRL